MKARYVIVIEVDVDDDRRASDLHDDLLDALYLVVTDREIKRYEMEVEQ